jgi:hypothetical protein
MSTVDDKLSKTNIALQGVAGEVEFADVVVFQGQAPSGWDGHAAIVIDCNGGATFTGIMWKDWIGIDEYAHVEIDEYDDTLKLSHSISGSNDYPDEVNLKLYANNNAVQSGIGVMDCKLFWFSGTDWGSGGYTTYLDRGRIIDLTDGGVTTLHTHTVSALNDTTITALGNGELLTSSAGVWINQTVNELALEKLNEPLQYPLNYVGCSIAGDRVNVTTGGIEAPAGTPTLVFEMPVPRARGGKTFRVRGYRVGAQDGDSSNKCTRWWIKCLDGLGSDTLHDSGAGSYFFSGQAAQSSWTYSATRDVIRFIFLMTIATVGLHEFTSVTIYGDYV